MTAVLAVTLPFFVLVGLGYGAARVRLLPLDSIAGLNVFVLFFALPCMLYQFGAQTPIAQLFDPVVLGLWLAVALLMVGAACALARKAGFNWRDSAFGALVATFPNTGFMGVPLILGLLGPAAAGPTIAAIMIDMVITSSLCVALAHLGQRDGGLRAVRQALIGVAKNPMPWSVLAGALASALRWTPPQPVATTVGLLAAAATPVALFSIGAVLWRSRMDYLVQQGELVNVVPQTGEALGDAPGDVHSGLARESAAGLPGQMAARTRVVAPAQAAPLGHTAHSGTPPLAPQPDEKRDLIALVLLKLVVHPLLVAAGLWALAQAGVPVPRVVQAALLLVAALPSAGNVSLLAERFGADNGRVARVILWTTLIAVLSFNGVVLMVLPGVRG